jgi:hypothetical protein
MFSFLESKRCSRRAVRSAPSANQPVDAEVNALAGNRQQATKKTNSAWPSFSFKIPYMKCYYGYASAGRVVDSYVASVRATLLRPCHIDNGYCEPQAC